MIKNVTFNDFRALKDCEIPIGENITVISGRNGIGKSTILAVIGNSCELKGYKTIFDKAFKTDFNEILKGDEHFDPSGSNKIKICFEYEDSSKSTKVCRITWQKEVRKDYPEKKRFRLIPETKEQGKKNSKKEEYPSLYLGLSRLYPVGEFDEKEKILKNNIKLSDDEYKFFTSNYSEILGLNDDYDKLSLLKTSSIKTKNGVGVSTDSYSSISNSAGQDNLGQILLSVMSFIRLKDEYPDYNGGVLLIDELDATLHPFAQKKLFDFLYKQSKNLDLQIIFTTHSESLLNYTCSKTRGNDNNRLNHIELIYISREDNKNFIRRNPQYSGIESDLNIYPPGKTVRKVKVYLEDKEALWMAKKLLNEYLDCVELISINLGCTQMISLFESDPITFTNTIFIFDGDVEDSEINRLKSLSHINYLFLPTKGKRPESVIYDYLASIEAVHSIYDNGFTCGFAKSSIIQNGPKSKKYSGDERVKYKRWFNENLFYFDKYDVLDFWKKDNKEVYEKFINNYKAKHNYIANRTFKNLIK